ncbi:sigma-54-dependent transcriptional regulator [Pelobacter propionicus]|uniref:Putative two component, sigma54 specific, transcriptional regulator, Fis family n=1 Tax=Pelobacter propionicus (strain DSM 2379 / NBRC 103807 / OttBd1) TaxID=338966 RepID=A1AMD4_PELPD|nr:sigma 54-interacting transcriptional regulator [Pelobacter propionicus]ABK98504.1 putative two component, sigma54 specific, transcriptional regulator, Fis family [Pelobacter propionicus DSM 2379]
MHNHKSIFIADRDRKSRDLVSAFLTYQGYDVITGEDAPSLYTAIQTQQVGIVIAELSHLNAIAPEFRDRAKETNPLLVLVIYGASEELPPRQPGKGNVFFLSKPLNLDELESIVMRAEEYQAMRQMEGEGHGHKQTNILCSSIIGKSKPMQDLFEMIEKVAESNATVLIQGESGTGKELAARAIHQLSGRKNQNFVPINCAAIPEDLLESELFGHVKGSFTGAHANRIGRFEMADKGTLFLGVCRA